MGYLPEALLNYLGRMGWSMPDEREKFSFAQMLEHFDLMRVSLGGPIFDTAKLAWLNGLWIREELSDEALADRLEQWAYNRDSLLRLLPHARPRMETFSDLAPLGAFLLSGRLALAPEAFATLRLDAEQQQRVLQFALWRLEALRHWERERIFDALKSLADAMGLKIRDFLSPLFVAIAGTTSSISVIDSMTLLGPDMTRMRLREGLEVLGGASKKKLKQLEKDYAGLGRAGDASE
jgi:glutamyl-tRNA synthetase